MEEEIDLRPYIGVLLRYWWVIIGAGLICALLAYLYISSRSETFQASALVTVLEPTEQFQFDPRILNAPSRNSLIRVLPELAKSDQVLTTLFQQLESEGIKVPEDLADDLTAQGGREPILLHLRARHEDPELAVRIANLWAEQLVALAIDVYANTGESQVRFYEGQVANASARLNAANEALVEFQNENRLAIAMNAVNSLTLTHASVLSHTHALRSLRDDIQGIRTQQQSAPGGIPGQIDQFTALALQTRVLNMEETLPFVVQLNIDSEPLDVGNQRAFLDSLEAMVAQMEMATVDRLLELETNLFEAQQEFETLNALSSRLIVDRDLALETYSSLSRKLDEEKVSAQDLTSGFRLASRASVPTSDSEQRLIFSILIGGAFGIILASLVLILFTWWRRNPYILSGDN
jgi:uncharacterized protein involved in exopolysaccharide biosynthesis